MEKSGAGPELASGLGLGAVVGLIVGLSGSPVTTTILGALAAGLITLLGFRNPAGSAEALHVSRLQALRLTGFGLSCCVLLLAGITIRTHDLLSPSPQSLMKSWEDGGRGLSTNEAHQLFLFLRAGVLPKNWVIAPAANPIAGTVPSVLKEESGQDVCQPLDLKAYNGDVSALLEGMDSLGGHWAALAGSLKSLPSDRQRAVITGLHDIVCVP